MFRLFREDAPIFEIGPKLYTYGKEAVKMAVLADGLSEKYQVEIIFSAQYTDIRPIAEATKHIHVFSQHVDGLYPGRGLGGVLPEAVRDAGAQGTLLNHAERQMTLGQLDRAIRRCKEVGLYSMVCADSLEGCMAVACLGADAVLKESTDMIAMSNGKTHDLNAIASADRAIQALVPGMIVLHGAGIRDETDVYNIIRAGARATGSTSAIYKAADPHLAVEKMIRAVRMAWDERRRGDAEICKYPETVTT